MFNGHSELTVCRFLKDILYKLKINLIFLVNTIFISMLMLNQFAQ